MRLLKLVSVAAALALCAGTGTANAAVINWATWGSAISGVPTGGSAIGTTAGGVTISYGGELQNLVANYPSWTPTAGSSTTWRRISPRTTTWLPTIATG